MGRNKTTIDGGPSLFEAETVVYNADRFDEVYNEVARRQDMYNETGIYSPFIPEELKPRAKVTYCNTAEQLREALTGSGAAPDLIDVVLTDYATLLCGPCEPTATPKQMFDALTAVKPIRAFFIDRYSLYYGLFLHYSRCLNIHRRYTVEVQNPDTATAETKTRFMDYRRTPMDAKAVCWLIRTGCSVLSDWRGFEPAEVSAWIADKREWAAVGEYTLFYLIAKCTYNATPQELERITPPPVHTQTPIIEFAENAARDAIRNLTRTADKFAEMAEADTKAAQEQATEAAKDWKNETNTKTVQLHETPNIICSRPVEISTNGEELVKTLPIQRYIDDFTTRYPDKYGVITTATVQKVVEAINLLPQYLDTYGQNGQFTYRTTINEFAEICGYSDANQEQQRALLGGLLVISDLWFVVDRPFKVMKITNAKGREVKRTVGGPTTTRLVAVEIENVTGGLIIKISPDVMKGRPTLISENNFKLLRGATANNLSKQRFTYQIMSKGHKDENVLANEVFGYDEKLKLSQGDAEATKRAKKYIQNHRAEDRRKIAAWFEEYREKGILTYKQNPKTGAYSWQRVGDFADQLPDEQ